MSKCFELRYCKNTNTMVWARCKRTKCKGHIYVSYDKNTDTFKLKTLKGEHIYNKNIDKKVSSHWLTMNHFYKLKGIKGMKLIELQD